MDANFAWVYLVIFLLIPLSRIIPRLIAKRRRQNDMIHTVSEQDRFEDSTTEMSQDSAKVLSQDSTAEPATTDMRVLGLMYKGANTFDQLQNITKIKNDELDSILQDLEDRGLIKIRQKQGLLGSKVELYPTEKGFKEFHS